ncbi:hypothetical protein SAMN02799630_00546 [Paenibacillus sp. UNCCL117]|uniref:hypothetical protein n=1 Tax=unclassified Paenibacillus TaxID=185978 RepID=UPI00088C3FFA|nr:MULTISPECIES: hypothetical protein [unclassified Paenibacillus]SDC10579.1 hypothetical protein SAMN04488602_101346 [Paenibacillus sp. cl123]SFW16406.1 hypothetical protein SAMN02799630_00546 [Paenibacillus sp. UNCCL117]
MKIGYHTVLLTIPIDFFTEETLFKALQTYSKELNSKFYKQEWASISWTTFELFKEHGLLIYLKDYHYRSDNKKRIYKVLEVRLNPKRLSEKNEYVQVSTYEDYKVISIAFKKVLEPLKRAYKKICSSGANPFIMPFLFDDLSQYKVDRIDYCINVRTPHMNRYMELIRRADKPKTFEMCLEDNLRTKRKEPYKNAFRITNQSVLVNFYNKSFQMAKVFGDEFPEGQEAEQIIRLEVQCKKRKVNNLKYHYGIEGRSLLDYSREELSESVLLSYYEKTVGYEDYYTLQEARHLISNSDYKRKDRERMIEVLELINQKRSIWKARDECKDGKKQFNEAVKNIKKTGINPVTIPVWWGFEQLPNLLQKIEQ